MLWLLLACDRGVDSGLTPAVCEPLTLTRGLSVSETDLIPDGASGAEGNTGIALGDLDGDGWLDAVVVTPEGSRRLDNEAGQLTLGEALPDASAVAMADIDADGDLDVWMGRRKGVPDLILWNQGGALTPEELPQSTDEHFTGAFGDVDGDGDVDLFVSGYAPALGPEGILAGTDLGDPSQVWLNQGDGTFEVREDLLPAEVLDDVTFLGQLFDADLDGDLDLYLGNDFGPWLGRNRLLRNDGAGRFTLDDDCRCDLAMFNMGIAVGDPDGDLDPDLYLTDLAGPDLLLNDGAGAYYDATQARGADIPNQEDQLASWGVAFVDLDRNGWEDLPMVFGPLFPEGEPDQLGGLGEDYRDWLDGAHQKDAVLLNQGDTFVNTSESLGFQDDRIGRGLAVGDLDNDGRPDLVTGGLWYAQVWYGGGGCDTGVVLTYGAELVGHGVIVTLPDGPVLRMLTPTTTWSSSAWESFVALPGERVQATITAADDGRVLFEGELQAGDRIPL